MNEIKCPKCNTIFKIDEEDYYSIVKRVRDEQFKEEVRAQKKFFEDAERNALANLELQLKTAHEKELSKKDVSIANLESELKRVSKEQNNLVSLALSEFERKKADEIAKLQLELEKLRSTLREKDRDAELKVKDAVLDRERKIITLQSELDNRMSEYLLKEKSIKDDFNEKLKAKDEQISYYKDFKARQSTKMVGESLEQHCYNEFYKLRGMFSPKTYFEKDNDAKTGSKGDFIFRDFDDEGVEIISIMFEMKNEADTTATKHKNSDFLKELDKDRKEKNCEYAVLVSLLEADSDLYNSGIVDVSHKYEKMYVIRPQFFIPIITILRNAALNSLQYKKKLKIAENQNIDIAHFEENILAFKEGFSRNYRIASEKFAKAIEEIDKTIDHLQKTKDALISSENQLRLANNKAEDLSVRKLTRNCKSVEELFENLREDSKEE